MSDVKYLTVGDVLRLHTLIMEQTEAVPAPLRDHGLLESALMRPQMAAFYQDADIIEQSAILAIGISQAQAFVDGNKRTAFVACDIFLRANHREFVGDPIDLAKQLELVATRRNEMETVTDQFVSWLREHVNEP